MISSQSFHNAISVINFVVNVHCVQSMIFAKAHTMVEWKEWGMHACVCGMEGPLSRHIAASQTSFLSYAVVWTCSGDDKTRYDCTLNPTTQAELVASTHSSKSSTPAWHSKNECTKQKNWMQNNEMITIKFTIDWPQLYFQGVTTGSGYY